MPVYRLQNGLGQHHALGKLTGCSQPAAGGVSLGFVSHSQWCGFGVPAQGAADVPLYLHSSTALLGMVPPEPPLDAPPVLLPPVLLPPVLLPPVLLPPVLLPPAPAVPPPEVLPPVAPAEPPLDAPPVDAPPVEAPPLPPPESESEPHPTAAVAIRTKRSPCLI